MGDEAEAADLDYYAALGEASVSDGGADKKLAAEEAAKTGIKAAVMDSRRTHFLTRTAGPLGFCKCGWSGDSAGFYDHTLDVLVEAVLAAALAVTLDAPCPTCHGNPMKFCDLLYCPAGCSGGRVPGESALVWRWQLEQVGGYSARGSTTAFSRVADERFGWEPVYRVVSPEEPKP